LSFSDSCQKYSSPGARLSSSSGNVTVMSSTAICNKNSLRSRV
jgi:hypothetical protein